jgi:uncharacterized protein
VRFAVAKEPSHALVTSATPVNVTPPATAIVSANIRISARQCIVGYRQQRPFQRLGGDGLSVTMLRFCTGDAAGSVRSGHTDSQTGAVVMPGEPSYVELGIPDVEAAQRFYGSLFGWVLSDAGAGGQVETQTLPIGIHGDDPEAHFELFFTVDDLDEAAVRVIELGGSVLGGVHDSGEFGRWVECRDDQGVRFGLRQSR